MVGGLIEAQTRIITREEWATICLDCGYKSDRVVPCRKCGSKAFNGIRTLERCSPHEGDA